MSIPRLTDFTAMMHDIAASAKIATCLLVTSGFYLLSKKLELYSWGELPQWVDGIAVAVLIYSAVSIVWEAVPRIWKLLVNAVMTPIRHYEANRLDHYQRFVLLCLAIKPAESMQIRDMNHEAIDTTELVLINATNELAQKGLISISRSYYGDSIRLTKRGAARAIEVQEHHKKTNEV